MTPHAPNQDRQVLVINDGPIAMLTAGFLEHAGLDPVVAPDTERRPTTGPIVLWYSALQLLGRLGLRRPIETAGTELTQRRTTHRAADTTATTHESAATETTDRPALVVITRQQLSYLIDEYLTDRLRRTERTVQRIEPTESGVAVTFASAIVEPFDIVVSNTHRETPTQSTPESGGALHTWAFDWPSSLPTPSTPSDVWSERRAMVTLPYSDGLRVQLLSTTAPTQAAGGTPESLTERFGPLFQADVSPSAVLGSAAIQYHKQPIGVGRSAAESTTAVVGTGLPPRYAGDSLAATERIEESWMLADALAYGPTEVATAVSEFDQRRRARRDDLTAGGDADASSRHCEIALQPPLDVLWYRRALAFSHLTDAGQSALSTEIPERL